MKKFGTREEVINGLSKQTRGGLTKQFLKYNAEGKIISIRRRKQRGGVKATHPSTNTNENSGSETNESSDLAEMYRDIKKLEYNQVYLVVDGDITYQNYITFIYDIINERKKKTTIHINDAPILVYKYNDTSNLFLINKLECNSSVQMIKSVKFEFNYTLDMPNRIDITEPNATFYTEFPNNCGEPDIDAIIQSLQPVQGGNPSHIQTGKRGGRFVVVGGRRRYLRK